MLAVRFPGSFSFRSVSSGVPPNLRRHFSFSVCFDCLLGDNVPSEALLDLATSGFAHFARVLWTDKCNRPFARFMTRVSFTKSKGLNALSSRLESIGILRAFRAYLLSKQRT